MRVRRLFGYTASTILLTACTLLSGADDLQIGGALGGSAQAPPQRDAGGSSMDGGAPPGLGDAAMSTDAPSGPGDDASVPIDAGPPFTRAVTFEGDTLTGTSGADAILGAATITSLALDGKYAMKVSNPGDGVLVDLGSRTEMYVTLLVDVSSANLTSTKSGSLGYFTLGTHTLLMQLDAPASLVLYLDATALGSVDVSQFENSTAHVAVHLSAGAGSGSVAFFIDKSGAPYVTPSISATSLTFSQIDSVATGDVGAPQGGKSASLADMSARYDDILASSTAFP